MLTKAERGRIYGALMGAKSLIGDVAKDHPSPFRRARSRIVVASVEIAIEILTESAQREAARERRAYRGTGTRRSQISQRTGGHNG